MKERSVRGSTKYMLLIVTIVLGMMARAGYCQTHGGTFKTKQGASIIVP